MKTTKMISLKAGDNVQTNDTMTTFLGFTDIVDQYSEQPAFSSLKDALIRFNASRQADLENVGKSLGYGHNVYAVFQDDDEMVWTAYLFNGKWCYGSSATLLSLKK